MNTTTFCSSTRNAIARRSWLAMLAALPLCAGGMTAAAERGRKDFAVREPMFPTLREYYAGDYRRPHFDALVKLYGSPENLENAARYDATKCTALVAVPAGWGRNKRGWGLYLHVSPADTGYLPPGWAAVLAREKLIGISPHGIGNDADVLLRTRVALDAMAAARREFNLDEERVFVGGFSGGGAVAARLVVEFPEFFRGAIVACKALPLRDVPAAGGFYPGEYTNVPDATWDTLRGFGRRWYFGTGTKDFNHASVTAQAPVWRALALEIETEVVPDLDHRDLPAASLKKALAFLQAPPAGGGAAGPAPGTEP